MFTKEGMKDIIEEVYGCIFEDGEIRIETLQKIALAKHEYAKVKFPSDVTFEQYVKNGATVITIAYRKLHSNINNTTYEYGVSYCSESDFSDDHEGKVQAFNRLDGNKPLEHSGRVTVKNTSGNDNTLAIIFGIIDTMFRANNAPQYLRDDISNLLIHKIEELTCARKKRYKKR